jgi:hypothetical protein
MGARQLPCGALRCEWGALRIFVNVGLAGWWPASGWGVVRSVADGCDQEFQVPVVPAGMVWRRETRVPSAMLAASWRMRCSPLQTGICPSCRAVSAASQSIQAIKVVPSLKLSVRHGCRPHSCHLHVG